MQFCYLFIAEKGDEGPFIHWINSPNVMREMSVNLFSERTYAKCLFWS